MRAPSNKLLILAIPLLWAAADLWRGRRAPHRPGNAAPLGELAATVFACGGFWYLRNAALTRNPMFPATISLVRRVILRGLLDGAALRASVYHVPVTNLGALAEVLCVFGWGFWAAVGVRKNGDVWIPLNPEKFVRFVRLLTAAMNTSR